MEAYTLLKKKATLCCYHFVLFFYNKWCDGQNHTFAKSGQQHAEFMPRPKRNTEVLRDVFY